MRISKSKTTWVGIGMIVSAIGAALQSDPTNIDWSILIPTVLGGIGLLFAKDASATPKEKAGE